MALANTILNVSSGRISIGDRTIFSPNVMLLTGRHEFANGMRVSVDPQFDDGSWGGGSREVRPRDTTSPSGGVWVSAGAIIVGGVTIGDNSIVAAGAVVTRSFPDFSILAGVPATRIGDTRERGGPVRPSCLPRRIDAGSRWATVLAWLERSSKARTPQPQKWLTTGPGQSGNVPCSRSKCHLIRGGPGVAPRRLVVPSLRDRDVFDSEARKGDATRCATTGRC